METTRVEKYAKYREEIQNSFKDTSTLEKSSDRVKKIIRPSDTSHSISYDDVMSAFEIYDSNPDEKKPKTIGIDKRQAFFVTTCVVVIIALSVALVFIGLQVFGGK